MYYFFDDERFEKGSVKGDKRDTQHTKSLSVFLRQTVPAPVWLILTLLTLLVANRGKCDLTQNK